MIIRINLLPHRQIKRAEQQRQFGLMAATMAALGLFIIFMGYTYISAEVGQQTSRNQRLKDAIAKLDADIKEIEGLKKTIGELKERIKAVESLQTNRSTVVSMLDEVARLMPEAVSISSLRQQGNTITLEGVADTNARVATLVGTLSASQVLNSPQLLEVKAATDIGGRKVSAFIVNAKIKQPEAAKPEEAGKSKGKGAQP